MTGTLSTEEILRAAQSCVGARFRPQGRDPAIGLDCIGLAAIAFARSLPPPRYTLRGDYEAELVRAVESIGLRAVPLLDRQPADLLCLQPGPAQYHLAVQASGGFIHADAALRRVVETPGDPPWPILHVWRERECD